MLHLVHRLPGSRTLTPNALAGLLAIAIGALVGAGVMAAWSVAHSDNNAALPLIALDTPSESAQLGQGLPAEPAAAQPIVTPEPMVPAVAPAPTTNVVDEAAATTDADEAPALAMPEPPAVDDDVVMFNGRPLRAVRTMTMKVTAYSPDERSCGKWADGITASGLSVWTNGMKLVAADTRVLPFRSIISVPGYNEGRPVPVLDRGGKIKGHRLDVLYPTHEVAMQWGVQDLEVTVWEYAD